MIGIYDRISSKLGEREKNGNLRTLKIAENSVDFYSNDYLGLAGNKDLQEIIAENYRATGIVSNGATGSRLLSGNSQFCEELEVYLAKLFKAESCLLFNSGYSACQAVVSSIPGRGDTIIYDEHIHACAKDGARLSLAKFYTFRHNQVADLEKKIKLATGSCFVVIESVYSMDGDIAPIEDILALCKKFKAQLIVDEAHSTGVYGENGSGLLCELGLQEEVFTRIYTFGKAMGVHGACVASAAVVKEYLINFARSFVFTTALPLHSLVSIKSAFDFLLHQPDLPGSLFRNIAAYRKIISNQAGIISSSAIQTVLVNGNDHAKSLAAKMQQQGMDVRPILAPTVKEGSERLRICLHTFNSSAQIEKLTSIIAAHNT